jgi:hypothetical protein
MSMKRRAEYAFDSTPACTTAAPLERPRRRVPATSPRAASLPHPPRLALSTRWKPSAPRAPDRRLDLSLFRTPSPRKSVKLHLAVTVPAVAVMAAVAGGAGVWTAGAAAQPAALSRPAGQVQQASPEASRVTPPAPATHHAQLDAFLAVTTASKGTVSIAAKGHKKAAETPRQIARSLLHRFGWSTRQFPYLNRLWSHESSWNVHADNVYSGAYGIPQAAPGVKMSSAGPNWRTSARTQILWGLRYIKGRYGSPAAAWAHELATGWY